MKKSILLLSAFAIYTIGLCQELQPTGQKLNLRAVRSLPVKQAMGLDATNPDSASLKEYAPTIATQPFGNCYAYSSVYAARTILYNVTVNETANPNKNIFSTGFIEKLIFGNSNRRCRNRGADTHYACELMQEVGVVPQNDFPGDCTDQSISPELRIKAGTYKILASRLFNFCTSSDVKINAVKGSLALKKPVVIGINSINSFYKKDGDPELWEPNYIDRRLINCNAANHAVCIIGYNNNKYGGAFEIQNSWGTSWKGDGYVWVKYKDLADFMMFAIELSNP